MHNKVSIVMATNNTPTEYLDASIGSILSQTYTNFEFIIVCDGFADEYNYIASKYNDPRIKVFLNKKNMGLPYSLNKGISYSTGVYIARMDSDDVSLPRRINDEINFLKKNKLDLCGTSAYFMGDKKGKKRIFLTSEKEMKIQLLFRSVFIHPTVFGRREVFLNNKYDEGYKYSQDFELWSRLSNKYKIGILDKCLLKYRMHSNQVSNAKSDIQRSLSKKIIMNNASKITGEFDEKIFKCLWYLSGRDKITKNDYEEFNELVNYVVAMNTAFGNFDKRAFKKVFYNRFFEQMVKNHLFVPKIDFFRKTMHIYNLFDLVFVLMNKV